MYNTIRHKSTKSLNFTKIIDIPLPEDKTAQKELEDYISECALITQHGNKTSPLTESVSDVRYIASENKLDISDFRLAIGKDDGHIDFTITGEKFTIDFGLCENKFYDFSFGTRPVLDMKGENEVGKYKCAVSAAWVDKSTFAIHLQVIDTYFGGLNIHISFKDDFATLMMKKSGQYVFDGIGGYVIGKKEE